jgi:hypothetical protein
MDLDFGEIYYLENKINGKGYVGQACCFTGKNNKKWGSINRWKSHIKEAYSDKKDRCQLLNQAIRKYNESNFELNILGKFHLNNLDNYEKKYIKEYDTLVPNGYNLNEGGKGGKDSDDTRLKKRLMRLGKKNSKSHIYNSKIGQIGNRRNKKKRKYEEDEKLPKYITSIRYKGNLIGYSVYHYPIGTYKKEYISFHYRSRKNTPQQNLELALKKLETLKKEYSSIDKQIKEKNIKHKKEKIQNKMQNSTKLKKLPKFIERIFSETGKIKGYEVKYKNKPIKIFSDKTNKWNLNSAKKYIKLCEIEEKDNEFIIPQLPPYVYLVKNKEKTKIIGFEMRKPKQKKITHPFLTLEAKYNKILKTVTDSQA